MIIYFQETIKLEIADLRSFLVIARSSNLRAAASELHQSASALSKAIRRLETSLNTAVFDRIGKTIRLNGQGERLRQRALELVALADQTRADFRGAHPNLHCRVVGPVVLQWRFGTLLAALLSSQQPGSGIAFVTHHEDAALGALARGEADFALVTQSAIQSTLPVGLQSQALGSITMQLAASATHALAFASQQRGLTTAEILMHDFACPQRAFFCGMERGARSDGWRDDQLPRRVRFWIDDLSLLIALVRSGQALAYLPDFVLIDSALTRIKLLDCPYECVESVFLVWRVLGADGWQNRLVGALSKPSL